MIDVVTVKPQLEDNAAQQVRQAYCRTAADAIGNAGDGLHFIAWLHRHEGQHAVGMVTKMGARLASGACALLDLGNSYGAAALVRQLVEVEYLLWCFADDPDDGARWLKSPDNYKPRALRKRSDGRFRLGEYKSHCERGGHPHPDGWFLVAASPPVDPILGQWIDLGQHLEHVWAVLTDACAALGVDATASQTETVEAARLAWHRSDELASRL